MNTDESILIKCLFFTSNRLSNILRKEFYFCTGAQKPVYKQLTGTPKASFCIENKFSPVMSFNGDVVFEENLEYKERAFQILPMLKKMYQEPTNPLFKVFHINIKKIRTFSYAEGPKEYSLE